MGMSLWNPSHQTWWFSWGMVQLTLLYHYYGTMGGWLRLQAAHQMRRLGKHWSLQAGNSEGDPIKKTIGIPLSYDNALVGNMHLYDHYNNYDNDNHYHDQIGWWLEDSTLQKDVKKQGKLLLKSQDMTIHRFLSIMSLLCIIMSYPFPFGHFHFVMSIVHWNFPTQQASAFPSVFQVHPHVLSISILM